MDFHFTHAAYVYLFHLICILPLLLFVGIQKSKSPEWAFSVLLGLAIIGFFYHGFKLFALYRDGSKKKE